MNYSKAIRIARALADIPQRELAARTSIDKSLISMLESGKRKPSLETLERISNALEIPFHLFTLLATEPEDIRSGNTADELNQLAVSLTKLLLRGEQDDPGCSSREARNLERQPARRKTHIHE